MGNHGQCQLCQHDQVGHQYSKGRIVVVSPDRKLVKTIDVPSPAAPNLTFGHDEAVVYIMAVDDQDNAPYWGKVYEVSNK